MNSKTVGLILAVAAIAGFALAVFLSRDRDAAEVVPPPVAKAETAAASTATKPEDATAVSDMLVTGSEPAAREPGEGESLQQAFADDHSLLSARIPELEDDDRFRELLAELREEDSAIAADKRRSYELLFYSRPLIRNATVTLDTLECGTRFCVAQFRANDPAVLRRFSKNLLAAKEFQAGATIGFGSEPAPAGEIHRLLFSHDPAINAITVPPGTVLPGAFETADEAPDIQ